MTDTPHLLYSPAPLFSLNFKEKLQKGAPGDFVVMRQGSNYTLLSLHSYEGNRLLLEEITIPTNQIKTPFDWKGWVKGQAPNHSSWAIYEIDVDNNQLLEGYSFSRKGWIEFDPSEHFLVQLLTLPLTPIPDHLKRRVGAAPRDGDDYRPFWTPSLVREGKEERVAHFDPLQGVWPKDGSLLSGQRIEFYFDQDRAFPFPYWMQIAHNHYGLKLQAIDSGRGLVSPHPGIPHRPPQFLSRLQKLGDNYRVLINTPAYHTDLSLFAVDVVTRERRALPIREIQHREADVWVVECAAQELGRVLTPGHQYKLIAIAKNEPNLFSELDEPFVWEL